MNDELKSAAPPQPREQQERGDGVGATQPINNKYSTKNGSEPNPERNGSGPTHEDTQADEAEEGPLSPEHQARLDRVVSREVQRERGYRTATDCAELMELGFKKVQARAPGILIPMWDVYGRLATYNFRPDRPRKQSKRDRFVKYEPIYGSHKMLDVPPRCQPMLADPSIDLCTTEGSVKVDWIASQGGCGVSLQGVWGWRGTNDVGGKTALIDWASVALNGRNVIIMFDEDIGVNKNIWNSAVALAAFLKSKGSSVKYLNWDWLEGGESNGN
jgi:hypothetical protein